MPLSTLKAEHLFVVVSSSGASYNKGVDNIDKMGNCVKEKNGRATIFFQNAKKVTKINGLTCSPCKSFLPGLFERINLGVNNFFTVLVSYH